MAVVNDNGASVKVSTSNIVAGVCIALIAAGVVGIWNLSASVSRLDERVLLWTRIYETRFERLDKEFQELRSRGQFSAPNGGK